MTTQSDLQALTDTAVKRLTDLAEFASSLTHDQRSLVLVQLGGLTRLYRQSPDDHAAVAAGVLTGVQRLVEALQDLHATDEKEIQT